MGKKKVVESSSSSSSDSSDLDEYEEDDDDEEEEEDSPVAAAASAAADEEEEPDPEPDPEPEPEPEPDPEPEPEPEEASQDDIDNVNSQTKKVDVLSPDKYIVIRVQRDGEQKEIRAVVVPMDAADFDDETVIDRYKGKADKAILVMIGDVAYAANLENGIRHARGAARAKSTEGGRRKAPILKQAGTLVLPLHHTGEWMKTKGVDKATIAELKAAMLDASNYSNVTRLAMKKLGAPKEGITQRAASASGGDSKKKKKHHHTKGKKRSSPEPVSQVQQNGAASADAKVERPKKRGTGAPNTGSDMATFFRLLGQSMIHAADQFQGDEA